MLGWQLLLLLQKWMLTVVAEKPDAGLAAAVAAAKVNAVQATVVAWVHTHASMVPPDGTLASEAGP